METEIFRTLAAAGDTATLLILYGFWKMDKRLTIIETLFHALKREDK